MLTEEKHLLRAQRTSQANPAHTSVSFHTTTPFSSVSLQVRQSPQAKTWKRRFDGTETEMRRSNKHEWNNRKFFQLCRLVVHFLSRNFETQPFNPVLVRILLEVLAKFTHCGRTHFNLTESSGLLTTHRVLCLPTGRALCVLNREKISIFVDQANDTNTQQKERGEFISNSGQLLISRQCQKRVRTHNTSNSVKCNVLLFGEKSIIVLPKQMLTSRGSDRRESPRGFANANIRRIPFLTSRAKNA